MLTRISRPDSDIVYWAVVLLAVASSVTVTGQQPEAFVRSLSPLQRSSPIHGFLVSWLPAKILSPPPAVYLPIGAFASFR